MVAIRLHGVVKVAGQINEIVNDVSISTEISGFCSYQTALCRKYNLPLKRVSFPIYVFDV